MCKKTTKSNGWKTSSTRDESAYTYTHYMHAYAHTRSAQSDGNSTTSTQRRRVRKGEKKRHQQQQQHQNKILFLFFSHFVLFRNSNKICVYVRHPRLRHHQQCNQRVRRVLRELHRIHMYLLHSHIRFVFEREFFFTLSRSSVSFLCLIHFHFAFGSFSAISFSLTFKSSRALTDIHTHTLTRALTQIRTYRNNEFCRAINTTLNELR